MSPRDQSQGEPPGLTRLRGLGRFLTPTGSLGEWLVGISSLLRGVLWNAAIFIILAVGLAALFSFALDDRGEWLFAFPHVSASVVAIGVFTAVVMGSAMWSEPPPAAWLITPLLLAVLVVVMDALPSILDVVDSELETLSWATLGSGVVGLVGRGVLAKIPKTVRGLVGRLVAFLLAVLLPAGLFLILLVRFCAETQAVLVAQFVALGGVLVFANIDFNRTSLHGYYKQRIAATFLGDGEEPKLSQFEGADGPLHLVNVALNLANEADPSVRDRRSDFFTLSCLHAGGPRTGYCRTDELEGAKPDFTLASAVAISGAAAAPNMGSFTDTLLRPLMTLLNVRMGYWLPHPARVAAGESGWMARVPYLLREMTGNITAEAKLVNVSDGGHIENLGAFELLRRQCKLIIVGDGEADPKLSFTAMATLIRCARVELNAEIEIDLDDLRVGPSGLSAKHGAVGTVRYADGSIGRILYLKSSLTGHEPPDVRYYKDTHPTFPHESTADQWFDDAQFDAYLGLGEEVVDSLFQELGFTEPDDPQLRDDTWEERIAALNVILAPTSRSRSSALTEQFHTVLEALLQPELADYRSQLIPTIFSKSIPTDQLHRLVPVVMMQLQLMERAVTDLGLIDARNRESLANRGWMNLFRRWAQSEAFRHVSLVCLPSFGAHLTQFMDVGLQLGTQFVWAQHPDTTRYPDVLLLGETNPQVARDQPARRLITGLARYERGDDEVVVERLVLRAGFEGVDRLEAALAALRARYRDTNLRLTDQAEALARRLPGDAYVHRPVGAQWRRADEEAVLAEQIALSASLGLCGVFAGSELRCVPPSSPSADPHVVPDVVEIASEGALICLRKVDGTVWCWGEALGGPEFDRYVDPQPPTQVPGLPSAVEIDVGRAHACARDREGGVWCWGQGEAGQLGQGLPVGASIVAVPVWPQVEVSALWVEGDHSCGLEVGSDTATGLRCWGVLPNWTTSLSVGTADAPGLERIPAPVEPRCVEFDLHRWVTDFPRVNADLDFTNHLALLGLARYDEELFWTQALDRSVEVHALELDGEAPSERLVVAQVRDPHQRHVFIRALFAEQERWCIDTDSLIYLQFGADDALGRRAAELLREAGRPAPDPVVIEPLELFGDGGQALLIHALEGPDEVSQAIWLWRHGFGLVSPEFVGFRLDYDTGATYGELQPSAEQPGQVRVREWVDCAPLHDARGCQPQRWEALWQFNRGSFIETERHHWLDPAG